MTSARPRAASLLAVLLVAAGLIPLGWALVSSLAPEAQVFDRPTLLPDRFTLEHYRALFEERAFWVPIVNSIVVAAWTTAISVVLGSLCAYALARLRFRGKVPLLALILAISMFPQISIVPPLFLALRAVGLVNTYPGVVVPYLTFAMPLTVWFMVAFLRQLPRELEEAAMMDGAGRLYTLWAIILPVAWPGIATTAVLTFLYSWNEFLFALSFTLGPERYTVPVAIALFRGQYQVPWGQVLAAALVATAPIVLIVLAAQRRIVQGLTAGAVKG